LVAFIFNLAIWIVAAWIIYTGFIGLLVLAALTGHPVFVDTFSLGVIFWSLLWLGGGVAALGFVLKFIWKIKELP